MKKYTPLFFPLLFIILLSCNGNDSKKGTTLSKKSNGNGYTNSKSEELTNSDSGTTNSQKNRPKIIKYNQYGDIIAIEEDTTAQIIENQISPITKMVDSPLKNLFKNGQLGKTYTKKELIEEYDFPKESLGFIKKVTYTGTNTLDFSWGSTWLIEKISDAKFKNGPLTFEFKKDRTIIKGGAVGIKHNKKIHTELIIKNGNAYIPSVKGYRWEIKK